MPNHSKAIATRRFQCRHIFTDGHRCGSPCLPHQDFCYYHHTTRRPLNRSSSAAFHDPFLHPSNETSFTLPTPEDPSAIQHAIGEIMKGLAGNALDPRRAGLLLYALQIASLNLQSTARRSHTRNNDPAQSNTAPETVEDFILDPELGPLAPQAEVGDNQPKGSAQRLLEALQAELRPKPEQENKNELGQQPVELPTIQAAATPGCPIFATAPPSLRWALNVAEGWAQPRHPWGKQEAQTRVKTQVQT